MNSWRALLNRIVDYAGLFPPASLDMLSAVQEFHRQRQGDDGYILSRFVLPLSRVGEFSVASRAVRAGEAGATPWHLSVIAAHDVNATVEQLLEFNRNESRGKTRLAVCDAVEIAAASAEEIRSILVSVPEFFELYVEIPLNADAPQLIAVLAGTRAAAKMRTGGVVAKSIPQTAEVVRFMRACHESNVPFKATAGLHHIVRGSYPLTYEPGAEAGTMFGYLNVFLAAAFMKEGLPDSAIARILEETSTDAFVFTEHAVFWREFTIPAETLGDVREHFARSFGSCSFSEPVSEAKQLGLLPATR